MPDIGSLLPGRVALVVNSLLFTPRALAACAQACKPVPLRRRAACRSTLAGCVCACRRALLRSRLRSCQTKKSIDFIWHVITWDWYKSWPGDLERQNVSAALSSILKSAATVAH